MIDEGFVCRRAKPDRGPRPARARDRAAEALVQVEVCGICNSTDWKIIEGEFVSGSYPILLGHESCGRVIAVGERVRSFRVGDRVLRFRLQDAHVPYPGGRSCWGGFVERAIVVDVWAKQDVL